tara:strand:+ start:8632 stop:9297 length:666 start_codon:yes stop_codon:yes gene_type:complete
MAETGSPLSGKMTEHEATYRRLRDMLMHGDLAPGQKVTLQGITATLGAGMTPVREALRRLTAEGALTLHENRRISVPHLTGVQLRELAFARLALEPQLAALALPGLGAERIARLQALDEAVDTAIQNGDIAGYLAANHRFHFLLYDAATAPILISLVHSLWLRFGPSLRLVIEGGGTSGPDRHKDALAAMLAGDADALGAAIRGDIEQGIDRVQAALGDND